RAVLVNRFPAEAASIEATYQNYLNANGLLPTDAGVLVGQEAALNIITRRVNDGSFPPNPEVFTGGTAPGEWRPTQPTFSVPMSAPWFGAVVPFALNDSAGLLPEPPPPHLRSGAYANAYNEVKALGARFNSARTPEQTDLAYFYSDNFFNSLMEVSHSFDECDLKSFERCGSTVLPGWLAGISAGGLYDRTVEELGAFALGVQVSRGVYSEVPWQSGVWRDSRELGRDLS